MRRHLPHFCVFLCVLIWLQACQAIPADPEPETVLLLPTPDPIATLIVYPDHATLFGIDGSASAARYRIQETFFGQVGMRPRRESREIQAAEDTPSLNGVLALDLNVDPPQVIGGHFVADLNLLQGALPQNGGLPADWLQNYVYPKATFVIGQQTILEYAYTSGDEVVFPMTGSMTVRDVTVPVTFTATAIYDETTGVIQATANARVLISDFGIEPPQLANVVMVEDELEIGAVIVARLLE